MAATWPRHLRIVESSSEPNADLSAGRAAPRAAPSESRTPEQTLADIHEHSRAISRLAGQGLWAGDSTASEGVATPLSDAVHTSPVAVDADCLRVHLGLIAAGISLMCLGAAVAVVGILGMPAPVHPYVATMAALAGLGIARITWISLAMLLGTKTRR